MTMIMLNPTLIGTSMMDTGSASQAKPLTAGGLVLIVDLDAHHGYASAIQHGRACKGKKAMEENPLQHTRTKTRSRDVLHSNIQVNRQLPFAGLMQRAKMKLNDTRNQRELGCKRQRRLSQADYFQAKLRDSTSWRGRASKLKGSQRVGNMTSN